MKIDSTFSAFKSRNFRLFFSGQAVSLVGTWMQRTAVSWIIYTLTHSTLILGITAFASLFPSFVLSLVGGVDEPLFGMGYYCFERDIGYRQCF